MTVHHFDPQWYYNCLGKYDPVLTINSGDSIVTSTVDAHGKDRTGKQVFRKGNPMTGPFFLDGAKPGDVLGVKFESIIPNRDDAWSRDMIYPELMDAEFSPSMLDWKYSSWFINRNNGFASPIDMPGLENLQLPLEPFLGCFGVAPEAEQNISTQTCGKYGGNMDYKGFTAGTTIYFPVFADGGLFFLGDGHALQGEGEVTGAAVETSMDIKFTLFLADRMGLVWPRAENREYIMTIGNAVPLEQAFRYAHSEMFRWLKDVTSLSDREISTFFGQCLEYDIASIVVPNYTIVCKIKKELLALIRK